MFFAPLRGLKHKIMIGFFSVILLGGLLLSGCQKRAEQPSGKILEVKVAEVKVEDVPSRMNFIGTLSSNFDAVIQPRVNGFLSSKQYSNGMPVRKGDLLFTIDPSQLSTTQYSAEAALESARANLSEARSNYERAVPLAGIAAISRSQLDQYTAQYKAAEAAVRSAEQQLASARMEVGYTELRSPIDGIVGSAAAHVGDYVGPGTQFNVLTTISNIDTVSVDLAIPMTRYLLLAADRAPIYDNEGLLSDIRLTLADGTLYPYEGSYSYTQKDVTSTMGTIVVSVSFPNPRRALKPGQFARVSARVGKPRREVVVPQEAVRQLQNISLVWVVGSDNTVHPVQVQPGMAFEGLWCIDRGLREGDRVVVGGVQKLHEGMKVNPQTK